MGSATCCGIVQRVPTRHNNARYHSRRSIARALRFGAVQFYHTRAYREASPQLLVLVGLSVLLMLFHTFIY